MTDLPSNRPDDPQTATLNSHPLAEMDTAGPESPSDDPVPMQSPMHSMAYEQEYENSTAAPMDSEGPSADLQQANGGHGFEASESQTASVMTDQPSPIPASTRASSASELAEPPSVTTANDLQIHVEESRDSFAHQTEEVDTFLQQSGSPPKRQNSWALKDCVVGQDKVVTYTWGRGDMGQLATGAASNMLLPQAAEALAGRDVVHVTGNLYNSAFQTADGDLLTCGNNDNGQLGVKGAGTSLVPLRVAALDAFSVHHTAVGLSHCLAAVADGMLASWGGNDSGQLGQETEGPDVTNPRLVKRMRGQANVRVAAGGSHSLMLTSTGRVSSAGHNVFGQLGHGDSQNRDKPAEIEALWPLGVIQIACGDNHSAALTADGRVFTWGRGKYGQLGLGSFETSSTPQHVKLPVDIVQVACGGDHTLAVGKGGELFAWGRGTWGQTGHGVEESLSRPQQIDALKDESIVQASAGSRHSLALSRAGRVYAFGNGELGQLGLGDSANRSRPVELPTFAGGPPLFRGGPPIFVVAAGDHSIAVCNRSPAADRFVLPGPQERYGEGLTALALPSLATLAESVRKDDPHTLATLKHAIEDMFDSPGFLIAQVAASGPPPTEPLSATHGLDMAAVTNMYTSILRVYDPDIVASLASASGRLADRIQASNAASPSGRASLADDAMWMRALFILLQNPINSESMGKQIMQKLSRAVAVTRGKQMLMAWLGGLPPEVFGARNVRPLQKYLSSVARRQGTTPVREELLLGLHMLLLMHNANEKAGRRIQPSEFYNNEISNDLNLQHEYLTWLQLQDQRQKKANQSGGTELVSVCQTAFCLTPQAKAKILQIDAYMQKQAHFQSGSIQALMQGMDPQHLQFLDIRVRREHLLADALSQILMRASDLKKPLRVTFLSGGVPEEGLDQGGVTKEFFQLLSRAIFTEAYGMFTFDQQTRTFWFDIKAMESESEFRLVGSLLGLAVYSSVILDVHFPLVVYKKLLRQPIGFQDLKQAFPELGRGLQSLLDFEGDVESTFLRSFDVEYDYYGELRRHELKPGGSQVAVTNDNRQEYVDLYTKWLLHDSIGNQFAAFAHGFHEVCGGPALTLFRSEELELLVCGLPHLDFEDLQAVARYDGGYNQQHPTIRAFWATLHAFSLPEKKLFLKFTTGSDRAPVGGLGNLELVIQRSGPDTEALPTSHTCFNYLLLPEYSDDAKLHRKLLTAINNAEGFGLQ